MLRKLDAFFDSVIGPVDSFGRLWRYVATGTLVVAMFMSAKFGYQLSLLHAITLGVVGVYTAFVPDAAVTQWRKGRLGMAAILAVIAVPLFVIEFYSHAGYTSGLRGVELTDASVANVKHDDKREEVKVKAAAVAYWTDEVQKLRGASEWAATTTAEAERAKLPGLEMAIAQEARRGGCKSRCLERTRERDAVNAKIAHIEKIDAGVAELKAAERALADARGVAGKSEFKASAVDMQQRFLGRAAAFVTSFGSTLEPTEFQREAAEFSASNLIALALTGLPALGYLLAGLSRTGAMTGQAHAFFSGGANGRASPAELVPVVGGDERESGLSVFNRTLTDRGTAKALASTLARYRAQLRDQTA